MKLVENYMNRALDSLQKNAQKSIALLSEHFKKSPEIVFDIGACIGIFSLCVAKENKDCKIYSFEPVKESYNIFCQNIEENNIKNIIPINKGLYSEKINATFSLPSPDSLSSNRLDKNNLPGLGRYCMHQIIAEKNISSTKFLKSWEKNIKKVECELTTIAEIKKEFDVPNFSDIIKIDCEGAEIEIIKSSLDFFRNSRVVIAEHHPEFDKDDELSKILLSLDYKCVEVGRIDRFWINKRLL